MQVINTIKLFSKAQEKKKTESGNKWEGREEGK